MLRLLLLALSLPVKALIAQRQAIHSRQECLPALPTQNYTATFEYEGCFTDTESRTLRGRMTTSGVNSPSWCANYCGLAGYSYAGVEYGSQCFCGDAIESTGSPADENSCNTPCPGNSTLSCGQTWFMNIYAVTNPLEDGISIIFPDCSRDPLCSLDICNPSLPAKKRAASLVSQFTVEEKLDNLVNTSPGVPRLGILPYQWWSEGLHGLASSPGTSFALDGNFSHATSFPMPINMGSAFDDDMVREVGTVIGIETRAFNNDGRAGLDLYSPTINAFKDPRWGRGQECPGEDPFHLQNYVRAILDGMEEASTGYKRVAATCKHYAANDFENYYGTERYGFDAIISTQDLSEYYLPAFKTCALEKNVGSFMCSYNGINGTPLCANSYLLEDILRKHWGWERDEHYITTDCDCVPLMVSHHKWTDDEGKAAALAMKAGTDLECNNTPGATFLHSAWAQGLVTEEDVDKALTRLMTALVTLGMFDPADRQPLRAIGWDAVNTQKAQELAYNAAISGMVLLKNKKSLPLKLDTSKSYAFIGPFGEAEGQMQGIYSGPPPYLVSPVEAAENLGLNFTFHSGSQINESDKSFEDAIEAAKSADQIIFFGGIDNSLEREALDRTSLGWPEPQIDVIRALAGLDKPVVVVQFGGGQLDDTELLDNDRISAILWAGLPGQSGGTAVLDTIFGKAAPAGRLSITQYPESYIDVPSTDMNLRPAPGNYGLGRTYMWYNGDTPVPFGHGLHYTSFSVQIDKKVSRDTLVFNTEELVSGVASVKDETVANGLIWQSILQLPVLSVPVTVKNTGAVNSDYVVLLFQTNNAGPKPRPIRILTAYTRLRNINAGSSASAKLVVTLERLARVDEHGNRVLFPGDYELFVDLDAKASIKFSIKGIPITIEKFPQPAE